MGSCFFVRENVTDQELRNVISEKKTKPADWFSLKRYEENSNRASSRGVFLLLSGRSSSPEKEENNTVVYQRLSLKGMKERSYCLALVRQT